MSQCTHVIVFNSSQHPDLPPEINSYPQIRVVSEAWIDACLQLKEQVDETPYLLQPINSGDNQLSFTASNLQFIYEWENDIRESVARLFEESPTDVSQTFKVVLHRIFNR